MTTNYHTAITGGTAANASEFNSRLSDLDTQITANTTGLAGVSDLDVLTTKGDIIGYSTVPARLAVGTDGFVLVADSSEATGLAWVPGADYFAILRETQSTGTAAGNSSAATWNVRAIDTEVSDARGMVTIASNRMTFVSGTYLLEATAPVFDVGLHRLQWYNQTQTTVVDYGAGVDADPGNNGGNSAYLRCTFTANGTDAYELRHYTEQAKVGGLGQAVSDGSTEIYAEIFVRRIA